MSPKTTFTHIKAFCLREATLCISGLAAAISCFFVPVSRDYLHYFDWRTLALLYCLMVVVSGFCQAGLFNWLAHKLCLKASNARAMGCVLVALCFFSSMLITNDVALLTFVPFALIVLGLAHCERELIIVIVLQTVAANLGSLLTPVGNPQNLFLHSYYNISNAFFFSTTLPVWIASLLILTACCLALIPPHKVTADLGECPALNKRALPLYALLFAVCLLVVFRWMSWQYMVAIMVALLMVTQRRQLLRADFFLLLTFGFFFVFSGNLANIPQVHNALCQVLRDHAYWVSLAVSQVISNVPAALLLSGFTADAKSLLLGVNIGGLGTPVASLASLISLKLYSASPRPQTWRFLKVFAYVNIGLLAVLSLVFAPR